jgi:GNAT superfamily N-acetyltransferase
MKPFEIEVDTNKNRLNLDYIHQFISNTYWANGRSKEAMETCVNNSLNFGVYLKNEQIGYARIVTDYAVFAYLMDVFVDEKHRGKGYGKILLTYILELDYLQNVGIWRLATSDAHGLYQNLGFRSLAKPEKLMELIR